MTDEGAVARGDRDVIEVATPARMARAPAPHVVTSRAGNTAVPALASVATDGWSTLAREAGEPNGFYLPDWALAVDAFARGRTGLSALIAWSDTPGLPRLIGLMPVTSLWRAGKIPLPALVSAEAYGPLGTPLLDRENADEAAQTLIRQARDTGARALILRNVALDGATLKTFTRALGAAGLRPVVLQSHARACLDATRGADELLRDALGAKKLKELRRQRHRLAEHAEVAFAVAQAPGEVAAALEIFLKLEASGWKAGRGTALLQHEGDAAFIRRAATTLAENRQCEIATLHAGAQPVAAAIIVRHQDRAFYFKLGVDEHFAKFSPGVQLTLDLTRHFCGDPAITLVDSLATPDHPMINPIWRGRLVIGDVLIPLRRKDPVVALIHAALMARQAIRASARRAVHLIRGG
jgi:CelD/BcsL family acetyltransferase involved in cellulose biosynthesis